MSDQSRYRLPTVAVTAVCLVLAGFCVWWQFLGYDYRSNDFTKVSEGPITGTCVEAVTDDMLKSKYDKTTWSCTATSKEHLSNLLAVSVHALYYANSQTALDAEGTRVLASLVSTTQGVLGHELTKTQVYDSLKALGTPATDCAVIYAGAVEGATPAPLAPSIVCDTVTPTDGTALAATDVNALYTHCLHQFSYGRSFPTSGTFSIPKVGVEVKPVFLPIIETNSTTEWSDRARIVVGTRWGYSSIVYIIFALTTAFFFMDCTVFLLAELTRVDAYFAQNAITEGNGDSMKEGMMTMLATFQAKRNFRWAIAIILLLMEITFWILLIGIPWNFSMNFSRPICETGAAEHWLSPFYATTLGGWKSDYDAFALEVIIIIAHIFIAIAVPIASLARRGSGESGRRDRTGTGDLEGFTGVAVGSLRSAWWFTLLAVGGLVFYLGQSLAAFRFGAAWAAGVSKNEFNEIALGAMLYDHVNAIIYMSLTIGLTLGSIVGRWLLAGLSCTSFTIFLIWVLLTVGAFIPPFFVSAYWVFYSFEDSQGQKDCQSTFGDSDDYTFARTACDIRAATYIAGIILLLVAALGPVFVGLIDYSRVACLPRRRAWVDMPDYWRRLVDPANPKFRTFALADQDSSIMPLKMTPVHSTGNGYRSGNTGFFNFNTRLTVPSDQVKL